MNLYNLITRNRFAFAVVLSKIAPFCSLLHGLFIHIPLANYLIIAWSFSVKGFDTIKKI